MQEGRDTPCTAQEEASRDGRPGAQLREWPDAGGDRHTSNTHHVDAVIVHGGSPRCAFHAPFIVSNVPQGTQVAGMQIVKAYVSLSAFLPEGDSNTDNT